jgi:hypothetical protein
VRYLLRIQLPFLSPSPPRATPPLAPIYPRALMGSPSPSLPRAVSWMAALLRDLNLDGPPGSPFLATNSRSRFSSCDSVFPPFLAVLAIRVKSCSVFSLKRGGGNSQETFLESSLAFTLSVSVKKHGSISVVSLLLLIHAAGIWRAAAVSPRKLDVVNHPCCGMTA